MNDKLNNPILRWIALIVAIDHIMRVTGAPEFVGIFIPNMRYLAGTLTGGLLLFYGKNLLGKKLTPLRLLDCVLMIIGLIGVGYVLIWFDRVMDYSLTVSLDFIGILLGMFLALSLLRIVQKETGWVLPIIIISLVLITRYQNYLPGALYGKGFSWDRLMYTIFVSNSGVFGIPLTVSARILIIFLVFAVFLQKMGAGQWFIDLALALTGKTTGGPAKVAVVASSFFGSISGSPSSNVATTGAFSIPMMKQTGFSPHFAGAVESVASPGGQILPPVMGAIAFIMADWLGVPYWFVVKSAWIPAIMYYTAIYFSIHFYAKRKELGGYNKTDNTALLPILKRGWYYLFSFFILVYLLIIKRLDPELAGFYTLPFLIITSFLAKDRDKWLIPRRIFDCLVEAVERWLPIIAITASIGIVIGSLELSGLALKFSDFLLELGHGNIVITLLLVGMASFILGMGLDSLPAYITLVILAAPALVSLGLPQIAAHLFVVYWGLASWFTPPVCLAVYVACGISGGSIWPTGRIAVRLGIGAFLVPLAFALDPAILLLQSNVAQIIWACFVDFLGLIALAAGINGFLFNKLSPPERFVLGLFGIVMISPIIYAEIIGLVVIGIVAFFNLKKYR